MRNQAFIYKYITLLMIASVYSNDTFAQTKQKELPRLIVNISIDQLRSDYLEAFSSLYADGGFNLLFKDGRVFTDGTNDFSPVDRASATATISTGSTPYYNGIISNSWLDRNTLRPVYCTNPKKVANVQYLPKASAEKLLTSTIGDELKLHTSGASKVFSVASECDAAILSAGHAADCAVWLDDQTGSWTTTSYYTQPTNQWLQAYNRMHPLKQKVAKEKWVPVVDFSTEASFFINQGKINTFTHHFSGNKSIQDYKKSALINTEITAIALECQRSNSLGADEVTDLLSIQYYAGLYDEKNPLGCHLELQDTYVRLDWEIKKLIDAIERRVGKGNTLYVLTSTGYTYGDNLSYEKFNIPTGNFYINRTANLLNMFLSSVYGAGQYVDACYRNHIYLNHRLLEQKHIGMSDILARAGEFLHLSEGVRDVHTADAILASEVGFTAQLRRAFNPILSGDIIIEVYPGWQLINENTGETYTSIASNVTFPIIFYGANVESATTRGTVSTDRIAPTIAKAIRIRAPNGCRSLPLF